MVSKISNKQGFYRKTTFNFSIANYSSLGEGENLTTKKNYVIIFIYNERKEKNMKKNFLETDIGFGGFILVVIGSIFILPWLAFWLAYFGGWIAKIVIGKYLVQGLAMLGLNITLDQIPLLAGVLGWIGGFFKTTITKNNNN